MPGMQGNSASEIRVSMAMAVLATPPPTIVESLLVSRPFGQTYLWPKRNIWSRADTQALIQKLNLL